MFPRKLAACLTLLCAVLAQSTLQAGTSFQATVQAVGKASISLMADGGELKTLPVESGTRVMRNAKVVRLEQLRTGDSVTVTTAVKNSRVVVTSIVAMARQ